MNRILRTTLIGFSSLLVIWQTGCSLHNPVQVQHRAPVEVKRGDQYSRPYYRDTPQYGEQQQQGYGRPAPDMNRPIYPAHVDERPEPFAAPELEQSVPAVARLVSRAEELIQQENYSAAAVSAEGALRLDPQSIAAYHTLARTYLFEERFDKSEQMALRALSLLRSKGANSDHEMSRDLWLLIAETRRSRGDDEGAEKAMIQAGGRF